MLEETPSTFKQEALRPSPDAIDSGAMSVPRLIQPDRQAKALPVRRASYQQVSETLDTGGWRASRD
jgi:hypothetical protein